MIPLGGLMWSLKKKRRILRTLTPIPFSSQLQLFTSLIWQSSIYKLQHWWNNSWFASMLKSVCICLICFWAFWASYLLDCFKLCILGSFWNLTSFDNNFVQFQVVLAELWAFEDKLSFVVSSHRSRTYCRVWGQFRSSSSTFFWKAIETTLRLVVVLLIISCIGKVMTVWRLVEF